MRDGHPHVAIDGPAASGKTTVGRMVADRLQFLYLDTGAMYRALTLLAEETQTDLESERALVRLLTAYPIHVSLDAAAQGGYRILAADREIKAQDLTSSEVTAGVSTVAAHPAVRVRMVELQRAIAQRGPVVMAGRDIGTVVLPGAPFKIFLTASLEERVRRRQHELAAAGIRVAREELRQQIEERDRLDETRAASPLQRAPDARVIDSSGMPAQRVADMIVEIVRA